MNNVLKTTATAIVLAVGFGLIWFMLVRSGDMSVAKWEAIKKRITKDAKKQSMSDIIADLNSILS